MGAAITERGSREIGTLELVGASGQRLSGMKPIQGAEHAQAMVDGLGSRWRLFVKLIADIVEQSRFIHFAQDAGGML